MASFNIAANTRRVSPVQEMLQARSQRDAHEINQLNIEKAELQMPYVQQLTQQKAEAGELALEEARTRNKHLEADLQQRKTMNDQAIEANAYQLRDQAHAEEYLKARQQGVPEETLRKTYPDLWRQDRLQQQAVDEAEWSQFRRAMVSLEAASTDEDKQRVWSEVIGGAPEEIQSALGNVYPGDAALARLKREMSGAQQSAVRQLIDDIRLAELEGDEELAQLLRSHLRRLSSGVGTAGEREAALNFPGSERPMYEQGKFEKVEKMYTEILTDTVAEFVGVDAMNARLNGALGRQDFLTYIDEGDHEEFNNRWDNILLMAAESMRNGSADWDWYVASKDRLDRGLPGYSLGEWAAENKKDEPTESPASRSTQYTGAEFKKAVNNAVEGDVINGMRYNGGAKTDPSSWERVEGE